MKTNAPRTIAVIGAVALFAIAFALGYYRALPHSLPRRSERSEVAAAVRSALANPNQLERAAELAPILGVAERAESGRSRRRL